MAAGMKRVLLVDDDAQVLETLTVAFTARGFEVLCASDGKEGLIRAERDAPDLIILDMVMPQWSGMLLLERLRGRMRRTTKVIMVSANDAPQYRERAATLGVHAFLAKPFEVSELMRIVDDLLCPVGQ